MQNFVHKGRILEFVVPSGGVVSGQGLIVGSVFGVVCGSDATAGDTGEMQVDGVFDLPMDSSTPTQFQEAYWNASAGQLTTTSSGNTKIGVFTDAGNSPLLGAGYGRVRLNAVF